MERIPDESIDLILCDLPYGTTANKWDNVIPFPELWKQYERTAKTNAAIVLTANQMFSYRLIQSNEKLYKYKWIWVKNNATNFMNAKNRPMSQFEEVLVFSKGTIANNATNKMNYFPQDLVRVNKTVKNNPSSFQNNAHDWNYAESYSQEFTNYPKDVLRFDAEPDTWHPTQKPVALWKYLVKTYCKQGGGGTRQLYGKWYDSYRLH